MNHRPPPSTHEAHRRTGRFTLALLAFTLLPVAPASVLAQDLPDAATLIDRYVEVSGGAEALMDRRAATSTGTFSMPAMGLSGDLTIHSSASGALLVRIDLPMVGEILSGYDGEVAWDIDPMQGARVAQGAQREQRALQTTRGYILREASTFPTRETVERTERANEACYRVRLVTANGHESFDCYSVDSGLLISSETSVETPMGAVQARTVFREYREMGGVMVATRTEQTIEGMQQVLQLEEVEFGEPDPSVFELPAAIQRLVGGEN